MKPAPKIPYGGKATAIFGLVLIAIFWIGTTQRSDTELSEAISSEYSKNGNLALALDVQTNQLLTGIDNYLLLLKDQYEHGGMRMPLRRLVAPAFGDEPSITFIGVTNERRDFDRAALSHALVRNHVARLAGRDVARAHQRDYAGTPARRHDFLRRGHFPIAIARRTASAA